MSGENSDAALAKLYGALLMVAMVGLAFALFVPLFAWLGVGALLLAPVASAIKVFMDSKNDVALQRSIFLALLFVALAVALGFLIRK